MVSISEQWLAVVIPAQAGIHCRAATTLVRWFHNGLPGAHRSLALTLDTGLCRYDGYLELFVHFDSSLYWNDILLCILPLLDCVFYAKITGKREMKSIARFLLVLTCVAPYCAANAVVSQTAGSNLTAYNGESGATNNNRWNNLTNARSISTASNATADFGNCNAVIMRCAQPKCGNGGCTDLSVTSGIVSGCVQSNNSCKQYGDELVQYIAAQLVASSTAKANAAANAAQTAVANAAAQQNAQQMAQMQQQMQQMQSQMAQQNAAQMAQLQSALDEQKQLTANAIAEATAAREAATPVSVSQSATSGTNGLNNAQVSAAENGVSADVLAREQISGQIMSAIENAETQLKTLKATMTDAFDYAGCDSRGNNCTGPKRVKTFKQKAEGFFDPYENVLDEMYDALILAQSVGVDITDIYMMLNGTCNAWAQYLCMDNQVMHYTSLNCKNGRSVAEYEPGERPLGEPRETHLIGGANCVVGQVVPMSDGGCQLIKMLADKEEVQRNWLYPQEGEDSHVRVGCASEALDNSALFRNRKKQASIDIETLQKIIAQDAPAISRNKNTLDKEQVKYCAVTDATYADLQKLVTTKTLPTKNICIDERKLNQTLNQVFLVDDASIIEKAQADCVAQSGVWDDITSRCYCAKDKNSDTTCKAEESKAEKNTMHKKLCVSYSAEWIDNTNKCNCNAAEDDDDKADCFNRFGNYSGGRTTSTSNSFSNNVKTTSSINTQKSFELNDFWKMGNK